MLKPLLDDVRAYPGISSKLALASVISSFEIDNTSGFSNGDDTAVLKSPTGPGYNLFAIEGFIPEFVAQDPWFAGWCGVMVNISDIAAMGGRPQAIVNALWYNDSKKQISQKIFDGMKAAAEAYCVPIVGGHTNHNSDNSNLAVSILGHTEHVLTSFDANPDEAIVVAIDHRGKFRSPYLNWNAATEAPPTRLRENLEILPTLAENKCLTGCKDISQAGLLGTLAMFMDCSQTGADIFLQDIPKPTSVSWKQWLCAFPSFGFIMTCKNEQVKNVITSFKEKQISAACIGKVTRRPSIEITYKNQKETFWNFEQAPFLGFKEHTKKLQHNTETIHNNKQEKAACLS